ncbi:MAG TPA: sulfur carrier protein ThiS [Solirubrobacteraceae bacterium]|jgi:sulfur carrier protein
MIRLNGEDCDVRAGETVADVLARLGVGVGVGTGVGARARGVAVAVDGEVVPRSAWETFALPDGARVEVLGAMQGG